MTADLMPATFTIVSGTGARDRKDHKLEFKEGVRRLPVGEITISFNKNSLGMPIEDVQSFLPADDYAVRGMTVRNRTAGLGAPLIAIQKKTEQSPRGTAIAGNRFPESGRGYQRP